MLVWTLVCVCVLLSLSLLHFPSSFALYFKDNQTWNVSVTLWIEMKWGEKYVWVFHLIFHPVWKLRKPDTECCHFVPISVCITISDVINKVGMCVKSTEYITSQPVAAVAHKRPRSFCWKCSWQVTAKYACTLHVWLAWSDMVHGCMVYTECAKMAAVSCGTSHASAVRTPLQWIFKNVLWKASHSCRMTCECSESAWKQRIALYKSNQQ